MNYSDGDLDGKFDENPWKTEESKSAVEPELFAAEVVQVATENIIVDSEPAPVEISITKEDLSEVKELEEVENEKIYSLDTTAEEPELKQKCLLLQQKIRSEIRKLEKAQSDHKRQASENKVLREYVANLLKTTSTTGVNKYGVPIASHRSSK